MVVNNAIANGRLDRRGELSPASPPGADFDELPRQGTLSLIAGKVSRLLARNVATKTAAMRNPAPLVTFCFDDVAASACTSGAPILEQYGVRGTYFVSAGGFGATGPCGNIARKEHIRDLMLSGHEIGCHTYSHLAVSRVSRRRLSEDLLLNRQALAGIGAVPRNFCYPYGDVSFAAKRFLENRFDSCRASIPGINHGRIDLGAIKANELSGRNLDRSRIRSLVTRTAASNGWLIFYSHDVAPGASRFGATPDLLRFAIETAQAAGCRCVTVADGLSLVSAREPAAARP
jgi:peptidoglycan/xylan/chitin deacetylase (PgdA/CDA1 family)